MDKCNFKQGSLPECAPLALAQTPMQCASEPAYDKRMALARGTLFPGLDLPFMNLVNKPADLSTPLCELMALDSADSSIASYFQKKGYETEDGKLDAGKTTYFHSIADNRYNCPTLL